MGKGSKERTIPIHEQAAAAVVDYLNDGRPPLVKNRKESALFVNRRGERLTRQGFWLILKQYAKEANITLAGDAAHVATLVRHSYAAEAARRCGTCRNCWGMRTSRRRRCTRRSPTSTSARSTRRRTRARVSRDSRYVSISAVPLLWAAVLLCPADHCRGCGCDRRRMRRRQRRRRRDRSCATATPRRRPISRR